MSNSTDRPLKGTQGELHITRRRLTMHKAGILRLEEDLAYRIALVKSLEEKIAELEAEVGEQE